MDRDRHRPRAFPGGIADAGRDTAAKQEKYLEQSPVHMRADMPVIQPGARLDQLDVSKFGAPGFAGSPYSAKWGISRAGRARLPAVIDVVM